MSAPWETPEMREWAVRFLNEEQEAGRTYSTVTTGVENRPGVTVQSYQLWSSEENLDVVRFRQLVTDFMERHKWDKDGGIEGWVETFEMAVMTYIRNVLQAA